MVFDYLFHMAKIGMTTYSLRKSFANGVYTFDNWGAIKEKFPDIQGYEILHVDLEKYLDDTEVSDLTKFKESLDKLNLEWFTITTDGFDFGNNSVPYWHDHDSYVAGFKQLNENKLMGASEWIENAGALGIKMMRIDVGSIVYNHKIPYSQAFDFNTNRLIEFYKECTKLGNEYGIKIGFENHGWFASDKPVIEKLLKEVPDLYLTLDTGNLMDSARYDIINQFADRVNYVHAKTHWFDDQGNEKSQDFKRIVEILKDHGFDGWYSIEFEGPEAEEIGIQKTIDLLKRVL